jgi:hypothetical protein
MKITNNHSLTASQGKADLSLYVGKEALQQYRKINDYTDLVKYEKENKVPCISKLARDNGESPITAYIAAYIIKCNEFLNLEALSPSQIEETSELIFDTHKTELTITDINLFFKCIKRGDFGAAGAKLDGQKILLWLGKYIDERTVIVEEDSYNEHLRYKAICIGDNTRRMQSREDAGRALNEAYAKTMLDSLKNDEGGKE